MSLCFVTHYTNAFGGGSNTLKLWHFAVEHCRILTIGIALTSNIGLMACSSMPPVRIEVGTQAVRPIQHESFVVADEPQAALVAREILLSGGNAADAAVALGFSLAVTLPSSAGLGGGGACMVYEANEGTAEVLEFLNIGDPSPAPRLAGGLFSLHARHGSMNWSQVVSPSEYLARFGFPVSLALQRDLDNHGSRLVNERAAIELFMTPQRDMLKAGDQLYQPLLALTLGTVRTRFSKGTSAGDLEDEMVVSIAKTLDVDVRDISRTAIPAWMPVNPRARQDGNLFLHDSGSGPDHENRKASELHEREYETSAASTDFIVADAQGKIVACGITMDQPFGMGIVSRNFGFLIASGGSSGVIANSPIVIAYLAERGTQALTLAAASTGRGAARRVTNEVRDVSRIASQTREQAEINMVYCRQDSAARRARCRALARSNGHGYAAVIGLEK
jgi:gamma-glutamyltranspeptidase / glutathione hydrolase